MWLNELSMRWLGWPTTGRPARSQTARRRGLRLTVEQLDDRLTPSTFNAATVSDLIADINAANQAGGSNTILLKANTTFDLTAANNTTNGANGLPVIAKYDSLAITGQGGDIIQRAAAAPAFRLLDVAAGASLTLQNLTLQSGLASGSGVSAEGGGIYNLGALVLNGVTVQGNGAAGNVGVSGNNPTNGNSAAGGGIYSSGTLTLEGGTVVQNNWAAGGAGGDEAGNRGTGGNGGNGSGGGLYVGGGTINLDGGTLVQGNQAVGGGGGKGGFLVLGSEGSGGNGSGGGLYVTGGTVNLTNMTLSNNMATGGLEGPGGLGAGGGGPGKGNPKSGPQDGNGSGGGLYVASGTVTLTSDTVDYNTAGSLFEYDPGYGYGGGLYAAGGTISQLNTTVEFNTAHDFGGGIYIGNAKVCFDAFTVANVVNNGPDNIYGPYTIC